jgi:hypothetical protein
MDIKLPLYFEDRKLWVEFETWTALVGSEAPGPVTALLEAAAETIANDGALIVFKDEGDIMNRCDRGEELQALKDTVVEARRRFNLRPLSS